MSFSYPFPSKVLQVLARKFPRHWFHLSGFHFKFAFHIIQFYLLSFLHIARNILLVVRKFSFFFFCHSSDFTKVSSCFRIPKATQVRKPWNIFKFTWHSIHIMVFYSRILVIFTNYHSYSSFLIIYSFKRRFK